MPGRLDLVRQPRIYRAARIGRAKCWAAECGKPGIIAAAGIVALTTMVDRLAEDHQNARALAQGLALVAGLNVRAVANRTNMVVFDVDGDADASRRFAAAMKERGVLISPREATSFRAVTHYGISRADIDRAVAAAAQAAGEVFGD